MSFIYEDGIISIADEIKVNFVDTSLALWMLAVCVCVLRTVLKWENILGCAVRHSEDESSNCLTFFTQSILFCLFVCSHILSHES